MMTTRSLIALSSRSALRRPPGEPGGNSSRSGWTIRVLPFQPGVKVRAATSLPYRRTMSTNTFDTPAASVPFERAMDTSVRPQDDLYSFINGTYLREHQIPADRARDGAFMVLRDLSEARVRDIITAAAADEDASGEAKQIGDLYASFMAEERIEALGTGPLQPALALVSA